MESQKESSTGDYISISPKAATPTFESDTESKIESRRKRKRSSSINLGRPSPCDKDGNVGSTFPQISSTHNAFASTSAEWCAASEAMVTGTRDCCSTTAAVRWDASTHLDDAECSIPLHREGAAITLGGLSNHEMPLAMQQAKPTVQRGPDKETRHEVKKCYDRSLKVVSTGMLSGNRYNTRLWRRGDTLLFKRDCVGASDV